MGSLRASSMLSPLNHPNFLLSYGAPDHDRAVKMVYLFYHHNPACTQVVS